MNKMNFIIIINILGLYYTSVSIKTLHIFLSGKYCKNLFTFNGQDNFGFVTNKILVYIIIYGNSCMDHTHCYGTLKPCQYCPIEILFKMILPCKILATSTDSKYPKDMPKLFQFLLVFH